MACKQGVQKGDSRVLCKVKKYAHLCCLRGCCGCLGHKGAGGCMAYSI